MGISKESCRNELRSAIRQLTDRCLFSAAKWAAEQLVGIEQDPTKYPPSNTRLQRDCSSIRRRFQSTNDNEGVGVIGTPIAGTSYVSTPVLEEERESNADSDFYLLAKSYFNCREYRRAAHVLKDQVGKKDLFLRCYALYLAGEKRKEEETIELEGPLGKSDAVNSELVSIEQELSAVRKNGAIDPFGLYLYGLVLKEKGNENLARTVLVESVNSYPWNC
ncbi:Cdc23 [Artemisia annua]|uniref:Cdc23 n=1 Tax=Artemisia annua TaxID=35608 RepID=A0A2U1QAZ6_ARTAN|nr:Cdc23 [Artemisia annua]